MKLEIKPTNELSANEIEQVFDLQKEVYRDRSLDFDFWKRKLTSKYHGEFNKMIQINISLNHIIDGYTIYTEPILFEKSYWRKIIESAMSKRLGEIRVQSYVDMINFLTSNPKESGIYSIAELWEKDRHIIALTSRFNLTYLQDLNLARGLMKTIFRDSDFSIGKNERGVYIERQTSHSPEIRKSYLFSNYHPTI